MTEANPSVLDSRDTPDSNFEPVTHQANQPRQDAERPDTPDANLAEQRATPPAAPNLPWYFAEKYVWKFGAKGTPYLVAKPEFQAAVERDCEAAVKAGCNAIANDHPDWAEAKEQIEMMTLSAQDTLHSRRALHSREGDAFERHLVERCTSNAVYAAIAQFELLNWAEQLANKGEDSGQNEKYMDKEAKCDDFQRIAVLDYCVLLQIRDDDCKVDLADPRTWKKAAGRILRRNADFARDDVLDANTPATTQTAGVAAARQTARRF